MFLNCRKATETMIRRLSNCLITPTCYRRCQDIAVRLYFNRDMTVIGTACQDHQAGESFVKCLSQAHTEWHE